MLFGQGKDKILFMEIQGLISEEKSSKPFQIQVEPSMVASVKEQLDMAAGDDRVKGILLMINSPGGTVTASDILYNEIRHFKAAKQVKVVALLNGTATSGAYYVAQAADRILAYPTTVTGSIGVILLNLNLNGLMEKIGVSNATVKSGMYKDLGSPFRKPEEGEKEILQGVVDELYGRFVQVVGENRRALKLSDHPELVDGRIFTARQALSEGLIDQIGYVADAVGWVRSAAAVSGCPRGPLSATGETICPTCIPTDRDQAVPGGVQCHQAGSGGLSFRGWAHLHVSLDARRVGFR